MFRWLVISLVGLISFMGQERADAKGLSETTVPKAADSQSHIKALASLRLGITALSQNPQFGDCIPIEFEVRNVGDTKYDYLDRNYDRSGRMDEYQLKCTSASGKAVQDPREWCGAFIGGGLCQTTTLKPGDAFRKTVYLNRWAHLTEPGIYKVVGIYHMEGSDKTIESKPIDITLRSRSNAELAAYNLSLRSKLEHAKTSEEYDDLLQQLMFTQDPSLIPFFIDLMYEDPKKHSFWYAEALSFYLPRQQVQPAVLDAALKRGLASDMRVLIARFEHPTPASSIKLFDAHKWDQAIRLSLKSDNQNCWAEGALAAQSHPNDAYTESLVAIAEKPATSPGQGAATYALAENRTDESVAALKRLLQSPDKFIREIAKGAVENAYTCRDQVKGHKLLDTDFDASLRKAH